MGITQKETLTNRVLLTEAESNVENNKRVYIEYLLRKTRVSLETEEYQTNLFFNLADEMLKIKATIYYGILAVGASVYLHS